MQSSSLTRATTPSRGHAFHLKLRDATRADHEAVDAHFGEFDLVDRDDYRRFLTAHAIVLPALEQALAPQDLVHGWIGRSAALARDLAALDATLPTPADFPTPISQASRWGALYVVEGSRLGGVHLARMVGPGLPRAYLSAAHPRGGWKQFLAAIDAADEGPLWQDAAIASAKAVFAAYADAADKVRVNG